jgi:hypothetical protein
MKSTDAWGLSLYGLLETCEAGFPATIPDCLDARYGVIASAYRMASADDRKDMRALFPRGYAAVLLSLGDRQVRLGLSSEAPVHLDNSLAAHSIEDFAWDPRENIRRLMTIWRAYQQLGLDAARAFAACADLSSSQGSEHLRAFIAGPEWAR